jgi:hypothetical protein
VLNTGADAASMPVVCRKIALFDTHDESLTACGAAALRVRSESGKSLLTFSRGPVQTSRDEAAPLRNNETVVSRRRLRCGECSANWAFTRGSGIRQYRFEEFRRAGIGQQSRFGRNTVRLHSSRFEGRRPSRDQLPVTQALGRTLVGLHPRFVSRPVPAASGSARISSDDMVFAGE